MTNHDLVSCEIFYKKGLTQINWILSFLLKLILKSILDRFFNNLCADRIICKNIQHILWPFLKSIECSGILCILSHAINGLYQVEHPHSRGNVSNTTSSSSSSSSRNFPGIPYVSLPNVSRKTRYALLRNII